MLGACRDLLFTLLYCKQASKTEKIAKTKVAKKLGLLEQWLSAYLHQLGLELLHLDLGVLLLFQEG